MGTRTEYVALYQTILNPLLLLKSVFASSDSQAPTGQLEL